VLTRLRPLSGKQAPALLNYLGGEAVFGIRRRCSNIWRRFVRVIVSSQSVGFSKCQCELPPSLAGGGNGKRPKAARRPYILLVHSGVEVKTVAELLAMACTKPGSVAYASTGNRSTRECRSRLCRSHCRQG
jgi:hypothetical protein